MALIGVRLMTAQIRMQADDFFKSYQILKKSGPELNNPVVVNLAFSLELYIKDIYYALKIEHRIPRGRDGHNVLELFRRLPEETQQEIRHYPSIQKIIAFYSMQMFPLYLPQDKDKQPITDIFEQQIYKISDAFEKWRYSYENGTLKFEESTVLALIEAVKAAADKVRKRLAA